jgi:hypothetical protein
MHRIPFNPSNHYMLVYVTAANVIEAIRSCLTIKGTSFVTACFICDDNYIINGKGYHSRML